MLFTGEMSIGASLERHEVWGHDHHTQCRHEAVQPRREQDHPFLLYVRIICINNIRDLKERQPCAGGGTLIGLLNGMATALDRTSP